MLLTGIFTKTKRVNHLGVNTPNLEVFTPNSGVRTPNPGVLTPKPGVRTPNSGVRTPKPEVYTPKLRVRTLISGVLTDKLNSLKSLETAEAIKLKQATLLLEVLTEKQEIFSAGRFKES